MKNYAYGKASIDIAAVRNSKSKKYYNCNSVKGIITNVSEYTYVTVSQIMSKSRRREIVEARHLIMYIAYKKQLGSLQYIGDYLNLDHATVLHGVRTAESLLETNECFKKKFDKVAHLLK